MSISNPKVDANIRLIILRALHEQANWSAPDVLLQAELERFAYDRTLTYIRNQLRFLESEVGAVKVMQVSSATIATLTEPGRDHVERRHVLEGVQRPSAEI